MSKSDDENINKIFNELMSSNNIEADMSKYDSYKATMKDMIHAQESLMETLININSIIYYLVNDNSYKIDSGLNELIGMLYKISEDFIGYINDVNDTIDEAEIFDQDQEDGNNEQ